MWYLVMFFRYYVTKFILIQEKLFSWLFCRKGYHCGCYMKGERCCECGSHFSESIMGASAKSIEYRQSER